MFRVKSNSDRKIRIFGFLCMGTTMLIVSGFSFYMAFFRQPDNITLVSVGIILIFLAISILDFWLAWRFSRVPVTQPNS